MHDEDYELSDQERELLIAPGQAAASEAMSSSGQQRRAGRRSRRQERRAGRKSRRTGRQERRQEWWARRRGGGATSSASGTPRAVRAWSEKVEEYQAGRQRTPKMFKVGVGTDLAAANGNGNGNGNGAAQWWMDPKVILLGAAAAWLLLRKGK